MQGKSVVRTSSIPSNPESPHRCQDCGPVSGKSRISSAWNPVKKKNARFQGGIAAGLGRVLIKGKGILFPALM